MSIHFTLTPDDMKAAAKLSGRRLWRLKAVILAMWLAHTVFVTYLYSKMGVFHASMDFTSLLILQALNTEVVLILTLVALLIWHSQNIKNHSKEDKTLTAAHEASWDSTGYKAISALGSITLPWVDIYAVRENKSLILLYRSRLLYNVVPKSAFSSPEQLSEFQQHLTNIPRK